MKENSRIRFNPGTKEIEIEGSESFVKTYFKKLQDMVFGLADNTVTAKSEPKAAMPTPQTKVKKASEKEPQVKKITNISAVVRLIHASTEGISTSELKEKSGLSERQIWSIVNRASKEGMIRKTKRGLYSAVGTVGTGPEE